MGTKQLVSTKPESGQRVRPGQPVEVADTPAPVREVEVVLGLDLGQRPPGLVARQVPRSTA